MWNLFNKRLTSRLWLGTSGYPSLQIMQDAILASESNLVTISLRRQSPQDKAGNAFWEAIKSLHCELLPNTAGCRTAKEAVTVAEMAREIFGTNWIKLEVIGDDFTLQPDPFELVKACTLLVQKGFEVLPYCTEDLILCKRLIDCGCRILMPWAAPIGSGRGILNPYALETLRARLPQTILVVDAGIGKPHQAAKAMELGFDAVLLNTAVSGASDPVKMAQAFRHGVIAGRMAFESGLIPERNCAQPSTPLLDTPFWHQEEGAM